MDARDRQANTLRANAARKAASKHEAVQAALEQLCQRGEPVTLAAVARAAGVSRTYLYTKGDLVAQIRALGGGEGAESATDRSHRTSAISALLRPRAAHAGIDALTARIHELEGELAAAHEALETLAREHDGCPAREPAHEPSDQ